MNDPEKPTALLNHAQDKIVVVDESGTYQYANAAVERLLGWPPASFVGRNAFDCIHPEDREAVHEVFSALVESDDQRTETAEYRHRRRDGGWTWLESRMSNRAVEGFDGYVVSSRDVTDRKRAEARERETETRLEQLAANAADILWMFSADWEELLFVNEAYEDIWGRSIESLRAEPLSFLEGVHPDDRDYVEQTMGRIADGEPRDLEYRVNPSRDYRRWVWVKSRPVVEDGEVTRIVGFSRDITDRRRRERQLQVMDNLLRHNLRNDMNVILGHAAMAGEVAGADVTEHVTKIRETGEELLGTAAKEREIIDMLVGIDDVVRLDLADLVTDTVAAFRRSYPAASVSVVAPDAVEAVALPGFRRALYELLENAAEHAETDPVIEVQVQPSDDHVRIRIEDNAPPIPGNEFEPLFGERESNELYHGTGLGLWLVYWVVDLSGGDIEFECLENRDDGDDSGNVITVSLPRDRD